MSASDIIVAGHVCLDLAPTFAPGNATALADMLTPGALVRVGACITYPGGAVANTGRALARIGARTGIMARTGDDAFGRIIHAHMAAAGFSSGMRAWPGETTSYTIVLAPPGVDRIFLHNSGANDTFSCDDIDYDRLAAAQLFHFGYPPLMKRMYEQDGAELAAIFARAKSCGVTTSLDLALADPDSPAGLAPWPAILRAVLPHVDIVVPSVEEVLLMLDRPAFLARRDEARARGCDALQLISEDEFSRLAAQLTDLGAGVVMLKAGPRGIYARTAGAARLSAFGRAKAGAAWAQRELWVPAFYVEKIANATGAGDCAIAGFLASFTHGDTLEAALQFATAAGRQNVLTYDSASGIRPYHETAAEIRSLRRTVTPVFPPGWRYDERTQLWHGPHDAPPAR